MKPKEIPKEKKPVEIPKTKQNPELYAQYNCVGTFKKPSFEVNSKNDNSQYVLSDS